MKERQSFCSIVGQKSSAQYQTREYPRSFEHWSQLDRALYPINYGFVPGTKMADGEELDAYVLGVSEPLKQFTGKCVAIIHRTNDHDDKLVLVPEDFNPSDVQIRSGTDFQEKFFQSEIFR